MRKYRIGLKVVHIYYQGTLYNHILRKKKWLLWGWKINLAFLEFIFVLIKIYRLIKHEIWIRVIIIF